MYMGTSFSQSTRFATCKSVTTNHQLCSKGAKICYDKTPTLLMNEPPAPMPHSHTRTTPHPAHFEIGRITLAQKQIWENKTCMRGFSGKKWGRAGIYADRSLCTTQMILATHISPYQACPSESTPAEELGATCRFPWQPAEELGATCRFPWQAAHVGRKHMQASNLSMALLSPSWQKSVPLPHCWQLGRKQKHGISSLPMREKGYNNMTQINSPRAYNCRMEL